MTFRFLVTVPNVDNKNFICYNHGNILLSLFISSNANNFCYDDVVLIFAVKWILSV